MEKVGMIDKINRFFAWVVSVNYYAYLVVGVFVGLAFHFSGWQTSTADHLSFLKYICTPIVMYSLVQNLFCQIFYQEKYDEFPFQKIDHNMHIGIPRTDEIFYSVINQKDLNRVRKFSGYTYAVSKPLIFINFGMFIVSMFFVMNNRT